MVAVEAGRITRDLERADVHLGSTRYMPSMDIVPLFPFGYWILYVFGTLLSHYCLGLFI